MKNKVIIEAMGKNIIIDNPNNIKIVFKERGKRTYKFKLNLNRDAAKNLERTYRKLSKGVK